VTIRNLRWGSVALAAVALSVLAGCSGDQGRFPVNYVTGAVFVNGKPAAGARLFFHPLADPASPRALRPFAEVEADGSFEVNTYLAGDGAPTGDYVVTVYWPAPPPAKGRFSDESMPPDRLKDVYSNPRTSKLRAHIIRGDNVLPPFQLP
jgi:hypothetical protein